MLSPRPLLLALDDDAAMRALLLRFLRLCADPTRYDVDAVATLPEVLAAAMSRPIPVLVTTYELTNGSGLDVALSMQRQSPATQILLTTAYAVDVLPKAVVTYPIAAVLHKPFALATFVQQATAALRTWEARAPVAMPV